MPGETNRALGLFQSARVAVVRFPVRKVVESPTVQGVDATPRQMLSLTTGLGALLLGLPR
jgi:hypothetical protein